MKTEPEAIKTEDMLIQKTEAFLKIIQQTEDSFNGYVMISKLIEERGEYLTMSKPDTKEEAEKDFYMLSAALIADDILRAHEDIANEENEIEPLVDILKGFREVSSNAGVVSFFEELEIQIEFNHGEDEKEDIVKGLPYLLASYLVSYLYADKIAKNIVYDDFYPADNSECSEKRLSHYEFTESLDIEVIDEKSITLLANYFKLGNETLIENISQLIQRDLFRSADVVGIYLNETAVTVDELSAIGFKKARDEWYKRNSKYRYFSPETNTLYVISLVVENKEKEA